MNQKDVVFQDSKFAMYKNHPDKENIQWTHMSKEEYLEWEKEFYAEALLFEPFLIENFYSDEDFKELQDFLQSKNLEDIAYTKQMNKWEDHVELPQKFIDIAIENVKKALGTEDVELGYYLFAHHQITKDGKKPFLQVHLDWSPGTYMVDLHLGGNRDWSFIAHDTEFVTKPNQAIIVQPEMDLHYREPWRNDDVDEYYQAVFFHLIRKRHWKNKHGFEFQSDKNFLAFQQQRLLMFEPLYFDLVDSIPGLSPTTIGDDRGLTEDDKRILGVETA